MTALFADTFYWIALIDLSDSAHSRALELTTTKLADVPIITTDEVLAEYLTFLQGLTSECAAMLWQYAQRILNSPMFALFRRVGIRFFPE
jgi:predicted nucleic acid-binding protein